MSGESGPLLGRDSPGAYRWLVTGIVIDLILSVLALLMGVMVQATSPTGKGEWFEMIVVLAILIGCPAVGWGLFNNSRIHVRWPLILVWAPILLLLIGIPLSIAYA